MYAIGFHVVTNRCLYLRRLPALLIVIAWLEHDALCEMFDDGLCFSVKVAYPIPGSDDCVRFECLPLHRPHQALVAAEACETTVHTLGLLFVERIDSLAILFAIFLA